MFEALKGYVDTKVNGIAQELEDRRLKNESILDKRLKNLEKKKAKSPIKYCVKCKKMSHDSTECYFIKLPKPIIRWMMQESEEEKIVKKITDDPKAKMVQPVRVDGKYYCIITMLYGDGLKIGRLTKGRTTYQKRNVKD